MRSWRLMIWGFVLLAVVASYGWIKYRQAADSAAKERVLQAAHEIESKSGTAALAGRPVEPFQLTRESGETFDTAQLDGEIWVASFFFTSCPGFCLKQNQAIADLRTALGDRPIKFVSITVDPEKDTPEELTRYAAHFQADPERWVFLTGDMDEIRRIANETFLVTANRDTHTGRLFLIDRQGRIVDSYTGTDPVAMRMLEREIDKLLEESS